MKTFSALLAICVGDSPVPGEFPPQRPMTRNFDGFFDLRLNKWLSKQSWGWWFETLSHPSLRHRNEMFINTYIDGFAQDCSDSIANAPGIHVLQSYTKPTICAIRLAKVIYELTCHIIEQSNFNIGNWISALTESKNHSILSKIIAHCRHNRFSVI